MPAHDFSVFDSELIGSDAADVPGEAFFRKLAQTAPVGIFYTGPDGGCWYVNEHWCTMSGLTPAQALGEGWIEAIHPDDRDRVCLGWQDAARHGLPFHEQYRFKRHDGKVVWILGQATAEVDAGRHIIGYVGTITDITHAKQTEHELRLQSEITAQAAEGISLVRTDGTIHYTNQRFDDLFGYTPGELIGQPVAAINAAGELSPDRQVREIMTALETRGVWSGELLSRRKDGSTLWTSANISTFEHPELGTLAITYQRDITAQRMARAELAREQQLLNEAETIAQLGSWQFDLASNTLQWSAMMFDLYGVDRSMTPTWDAFLGRILHDDRLATSFAFENAKRSHAQFDITHRALLANGDLRYVRLIGHFTFAPEGTPTCVKGIAQDVTMERIQALELKTSEERFHAMLEASPIPCAVNDEFAQIIYLNGAFTQCLGYSQLEIPTLEHWWRTAYPDPEYRQWVSEVWGMRLQSAALTGTRFEPLEVMVRAKDGNTLTVIASAAPLGDKLSGLHLVTLYDITERKRLENVLRQSEARFRAVIEGTTDAVYVKDCSGRYLMVNSATAAFAGKTPSEIIGCDDGNVFSPDEAAQIMTLDQAIMQSGTVQICEERLTTADGTARIFLTTKGPIRNDEGTVIGLFGIARDITARTARPG